MKSKPKKLIAILVLLGIAMPYLAGINFSYAQTNQTPPTTQPGGIKVLQENLNNVSCGIIATPTQYSIFSLECISKGAATISFIWLEIVGVVLNIAGLVFNMTLGVTIDNLNYSASRIPMLYTGWSFSRDIVNIFFIFILLFIAIATILQIESYGAKALLARLIIIALLVNFSFLTAQAIIFVSNSLTTSLYQTINVVNGSTMSSVSATASFLSLQNRKDISAAIVSAFDPQVLLARVPTDVSVNAADKVKVFLSIIEIALIGTVIILAASFVLFVGAFFFVVRMAVLWLLLVLAPFGFVLLILPLTRGTAQKWWTTLTRQAIFAPAFMFFLLLVIKMIQSGLANFLKGASNMNTTEMLFLLILQGTIMVILLFATLIVAKEVGMHGAGAAIGMASKAGSAFRGYVGKSAWGGAKYLGRKTKQGVQKTLGRTGDILYGGGDSKIRSFIAKPLQKTGAKADARGELEKREKYKAKVKDLSGARPETLAKLMPTLRPGEQRELLEMVKGKNRELMISEMEKRDQKTGGNSVTQLGNNMKQFKLEKDVAKASNSLVRSMEIMHPEINKDKNPEEYKKEMAQWFSDLNNNERANLNPDEIENNVDVQNTIFETVNIRGLNAMLKNRKQRDAIVKASRNIITKHTGLELSDPEVVKAMGEEASKYLASIIAREYQNPELAKGMSDNIAANLIAGGVRVASKDEYVFPPRESQEPETKT